MLESHVEVQEGVLAGIQAERIEAERLTDSVGRLGEGANALGEALLTVSKQQQRLADIEKELVPREEIESKLSNAAEKQAKTTLEFRKRTLARIYATGLLLTLLLSVLGAVAYSYHQSKLSAQKDICQARSEQTSIIIDVLVESIKDAPEGPQAQYTRDAIKRFRNLNADCESL